MKPPPGPLGAIFPFLFWWPLVNRATLRDDLLAGLTGALIVLPQGVAFATIAGLPPQYGLYAAMIPAVVAALFGSSWHLVSGPTTAISIAVFAALSHQAEPGTEHYIRLVLTMTFLVGVFQLVLGLARMGALVNFISHTVVIGFTTGAAILIAASQVRNFFGIEIPRGTPFYEILRQLVVQFDRINPWVLTVSVATLVSGILTRRYFKKLPYMIAAMVIGSLVAEGINLWMGQGASGIRTVGALPGSLPPLSIPDFSVDTLRHALGPALVITMLALTEAVSISRAISVRSEQRIDANQEFIGQGLSNIVGAFFSSYASSGSFNRSGVNYEAGARTPLASVFATAFLILILLLVAPLAAYLPDATMAGILFLVAWGLIDLEHISHIWHTSKAESLILIATLVGTLFNLEAGIFVGVFLSLVFYLYRSSKPEIVPLVPAPEAGAYHFIRAKGRLECPQLRIVRINGSVYFGAANYVQQALQQIDEDNPLQKSVLIAAASLNSIDIAGAEILAQEARRRRKLGGGLYFYRLNRASYDFLREGGYVHEIGEGAFFPVMTDVTSALYWTLDPEVCRHCKTRIFAACNSGRLPDGDRRVRLLLAGDESGMAQDTAATAIALARRLGVALDVAVMRRNDENEESFGDRTMAIQRNAIAADVPTEFHRRDGRDLAAVVHEVAQATSAQLLVVGRRMSNQAGGTIGPVAQRTIAESPCSVLIVPPEGRLWSNRILVAFDGSSAARSAFDFAVQLAKPGDTPITLFSVTDKQGRLPAQINDEAELALAWARMEGVTAERLTRGGHIAEAILAAATETGADLIVMYRHTRGRLGRTLIGSVSQEVLLRANVPVLISGSASRLDGDQAG